MNIFKKKIAPKFQANSTLGIINTDNYIYKKKIVLFFYPKNNTPGCTRENIDFRNYYEEFVNINTEIIGVSRDTIASHENFKIKYDLPFPLISDQDEVVCNLYNVIKSKNMYGKIVRGIERSTFIIDDEGYIAMEWRKVKVDGHVSNILNFLNSMQNED